MFLRVFLNIIEDSPQLVCTYPGEFRDVQKVYRNGQAVTGLRRIHGTILALVWALLLLGGAFRPKGAAPAGPPRPLAGHPAPSLALADLSGRRVSLADFEGQAVFLNFWASWCGPCRAEMPEIERLAASPPAGAAVLTVNLTARETSASAPLAYLAENGYSFPVLLDPGDEAGALFQVASMPTSLFISPDGVVAARVTGPLTYRAMRDYLAAAAAGRATPRTGRSPASLLSETVSLGPAVLPTRALFWLAGLLLAYAVAGRSGTGREAAESAPEVADRSRETAERARDLVLNLAIGGVLGAKLLYVLLDPGAYLRSPLLLLSFPYGTRVLPGALTGGLALALWGLRSTPHRLQVWDRALPALLLGAGTGALGSPAPADWALGPTLLAAGLLNLLIISRTAPAAGEGAVTALLPGALAVAAADLVRPSGALAGVTVLQLAAAVTATAAWLWWRRRASPPSRVGAP